jgi:hypothetical protein
MRTRLGAAVRGFEALRAEARFINCCPFGDRVSLFLPIIKQCVR